MPVAHLYWNHKLGMSVEDKAASKQRRIHQCNFDTIPLTVMLYAWLSSAIKL